MAVSDMALFEFRIRNKCGGCHFPTLLAQLWCLYICGYVAIPSSVARGDNMPPVVFHIDKHPRQTSTLSNWIVIGKSEGFGFLGTQTFEMN